MTMPPYDWTKHRASTESKEAIASAPAPARTVEVPLEPAKGVAPARDSMNGFVLRRMQRMASDRWGRAPAAAPASTGGRAPPRRCASNEEQVFDRLEQLRRNSDDSNASSCRRKKLHKTKSATHMVNRTSTHTPEKKVDAPRRIPRRSISHQAPRATSIVEGGEPRRTIRRTVSSSGKRTKSSKGAPKQPQRALSPIPRKKNSVAPIAA